MKYFLANCVVSIFIIRDVSTGDSEIKEVTVNQRKNKRKVKKYVYCVLVMNSPPFKLFSQTCFCVIHYLSNIGFLTVMWVCLQ